MSDIYPRAAGECFQHVKHLRKSVQELLKLVDQDVGASWWIINSAKTNLDLSAFADKEFNDVYFPGEES